MSIYKSVFAFVLCFLGSNMAIAQVVNAPFGTSNAIVGPPGGSAGCVQLYATATTLAGCVGTIAKIGTQDVGFPGEVFVVDTPTTVASGAIQFSENWDLNLVANETGEHLEHYSIMNLNGTVNYSAGGGDAPLWGTVNVNTTGTVGAVGNPTTGVAGQVDFLAGATGGVVTGLFGTCQAGFNATLTSCSGVWGQVSSTVGDTITNASDFYAQAPLGGSTGYQIFFGYFEEGIGGAAAQAFDEWYDERGVWAIHSINTFNAVYQARPALYNPQFTKFSLTQLNTNSYERIVTQWESNEAVVRTEAGSGAGTLRRLGLGGAGVDILTGGFDITTNVVNPFIMAKNTQAATAPAAGNCDLRWVAGTNAGTGKIVAACGTSATEVTIADNIGSGF